MDSVALKLGPITVHWFGVFVAAGIVLGIWNASRRGMKAGIPPEQVWDSVLWLVVGVVVGARLWFVVSYWEESFQGRSWLEIFKVHQGGLVYYGGLLGASLAFLLYVKWHRLPLWKLADVLAPSISLGYAIGRQGCLMNGCCYGAPAEVPWAIRFPVGHETAGQPVHPTQIYEALLGLGLYAVLSWIYRRRRFDGQVFGCYLVGYGVARGVVECFRGDYKRHYWGGWATEGLVVSVLCFAAGLVWLAVLAKRHRHSGLRS